MFLSMPGYIAALINNGDLQIIKASADGFTKVASYRVADDRTWAPPVLLADGVLVKDHDKLTLWSLTN
jgi:hypothetical protein